MIKWAVFGCKRRKRSRVLLPLFFTLFADAPLCTPFLKEEKGIGTGIGESSFLEKSFLKGSVSWHSGFVI